METRTYTISEMEAQRLIGKGFSSTDSKYTAHDAGNEVIALAEQIKAERAVIAMELR